jgi:thiamine biosynthesis lipoprotein
VITTTEEVMGTVVSFLIDPGVLTTRELDDVLGEVRRELHQIDERFSTYRSDSELSRLRRHEVRTPSALMCEVVDLCERAREMSRGFFDPWASPGGFDPTGLVKGWAGERVLSILAAAGVAAALVNAGGDVCVLAGRTYEVGIRHPLEPDALCAVVTTHDSVATSGVYERGNHLFNPFGGPTASISATVVGGRLALADAMATALAVGGKDVLFELETLDGLQGFFVTPEGELFKTAGMELMSDQRGR